VIRRMSRGGPSHSRVITIWRSRRGGRAILRDALQRSLG
jgi:hypothetical protein